MSQPLITVIVHAFNHEKQIEAALESVREQDHDGIELIVVDDRSQDRTASLVRQYTSQSRAQSRFQRIAVIEQEAPAGAPAAINRGLQEARGSYVNVLLGDERFASGRLSTLLRACTERQAEVAFARVQPSVETRGRLSPEVEQFFSVQESIGFFPTVGYALLSNPCTLSVGNIFFSRPVLERVGDFSNLQYFYDWDFVLRCVLVSEPIFVPQPLYFCRVRGTDTADRDDVEKAMQDERDRVLKNYLFLCRTRPADNPVAPSPAWGPFFESFVQASRYAKYLGTP
jgi:glycosyltransferase involved in cell wall biosynthesis